ncbi:MAG: hypothetical protein AABW68_05430 [archaeon]
MDALQRREKEIFDTLGAIRGHSFVVIGGYAVNAYTLPRFSVDCDIVTGNPDHAHQIGELLIRHGYTHEKTPPTAPYHGSFERYEKRIEKDFTVSMDILIGHVMDRQTDSIFSWEWIREHSAARLLRGKTIIEELKVDIIDIDALFVMKFICARATDIRDIFMLAPDIQEREWIKKEIIHRYDFDERLKWIKEKVQSKQFKDGLQGVYGIIHPRVFEKHRKALLEI